MAKILRKINNYFNIIILFSLLYISCSIPDMNDLNYNEAIDKEVMGMIEEILFEINCVPENFAVDEKNHMGRLSDFYDLYSKNSMPNIVYTNKYWTDLGYYYDKEAEHIVFSYYYIFIFPREYNGKFYLATDFFSNYYETFHEGILYEVREYDVNYLLGVRNGMLNQSDPSIDKYREVGSFVFTADYDDKHEVVRKLRRR